VSNVVEVIVGYALSFLFVIPALTLHEWAHAYVATRLGDPTSRMLGRLSLNPLRHIDPLGTVLLPIGLLVLSGGAFTFGYAKPVPVNPRYFKDQRKGMMQVGLAGPLMNVALALLSGILVRLLWAILILFVADGSVLFSVLGVTLTVVMRFCYINLVLCFFNLLPIPPFDGSRVVQKLLKGEARRWYNQLETYGIYIILALVWVVPMIFGPEADIIAIYFRYTAEWVFGVLTGIPIDQFFG